jgi:SAM-dependent methyltransferase
MTEKYSPQHPREVRRLSESQYRSIWEGYADARRALYPYEVPPGEERRPYNIWEDMADHVDPVNASMVIEFGTNDGYFHSILRHRGFSGKFVGIDIEGKDLPSIEFIAHQRFPDADIDFIQGDAQDLRGIIADSSTPVAAANFITYHAEKPGRIFSELHRILEPQGKGLVSSRNVTNQKDTWEVARWVAHSHGFAFPQELTPDGKFIPGVTVSRLSVYSHFDIDQTRRSLEGSKKFRILHEHIQDTDLWIPTDNEAGLFDLGNVVESLLPYTVGMNDRSKPNQEDMENMHEFIHNHMRHYFIVSGAKNQRERNLPGPYHISHATQGFFVVEALK